MTHSFGHDDVIKWKHFRRNWPFVRGIHRSPVNSPYKGQWRRALMFSLIYARINGWVNNRGAGDLRRHPDHYDVNVVVLTYNFRTGLPYIMLTSMSIRAFWLGWVMSMTRSPAFGPFWNKRSLEKAVRIHSNNNKQKNTVQYAPYCVLHKVSTWFPSWIMSSGQRDFARFEFKMRLRQILYCNSLVFYNICTEWCVLFCCS